MPTEPRMNARLSNISACCCESAGDRVDWACAQLMKLAIVAREARAWAFVGRNGLDRCGRRRLRRDPRPRRCTDEVVAIESLGARLLAAALALVASDDHPGPVFAGGQEEPEGQTDVYRGNTHERGHSESSQFWRGPRARAFGSTKPMALKRSSTGTP